MKKIVTILLALVLLVGMTACGGGGADSDDPNLGLYTAAAGEMWGVEFDDVNEYFGQGFTIELKANGKCALNVDGSKANGSWTLDESGAFTVKGGGLECAGTLGGGVMTLEDVLGMGMTLVLVNENYSGGAGGDSGGMGGGSDVPAESASLSEGYAWWDGEWCGWYRVLEGKGAFSEIDGDSWECSAFIDMKADGTGDVYLWDDFKELGTVKIKVDLNEGDGMMGELAVVSGTMFGTELEEGHWYSDPADEDVDDLFYTYSDVRTSNDDYARFEIYLRPWGTLWDDMPTELHSAGYENWYLIMIEEHDSLLAALEESELLDGGSVFIHPGLPARAWAESVGGVGSSEDPSGGSGESAGGSSGGGTDGTAGGGPLVGTWMAEGDGAGGTANKDYQYEFGADGTGAYTIFGDKRPFTYTVNGNVVNLLLYPGTSDEEEDEFEFELNGDKLNITTWTGSKTYLRQ